MAKILTHTYYYIDVSSAPYWDGTLVTNLTVLDRKITFTKYIKIICETEDKIVIEENPGDYPRRTMYYKTKSYAQNILSELLKKPIAIEEVPDRTLSEVHLRIGGFKER